MRLAVLMLLAACSGDSPTTFDATPTDDAGTQPPADSAIDAPAGPNVDRTNPQLHSYDFTAAQADAAASQALGHQLGYLDTRVEPRGLLVVYLHGAITVNATTTCGSRAHGEVLAAMGFHTLHPCYVSDYGVANCGSDIAGCRLEAFEGIDHTAVINIAPANAIEPRIVAALQHLAALHPGGDWSYYLEGNRPRWSRIIISGHSHGASSAALIGKVRTVERVISLAGPLDTGQAWLAQPSTTPIDRFYGFTHSADSQHQGHLQAFATMGLLGTPTNVDTVASPFGNSHRLFSSVATTNGHGAVQAGPDSPTLANGTYRYLPVWQYMYGATP
jgi:hypothetical protein